MNQREKILAGAAVVTALVFGVPMVVNAFGSSQSTDQIIAKMNADRADKERLAKHLSSEATLLRPQVETLAWNVSTDQLRQEIVRRLSAIVQNSNVTLITTRPLKPRPLDVMTEVSVEMHLTSTLSDLVKFLYPLQQPNSRLSVDRLRMAATNSDTELLDVDVTVSGYTLQIPTEEKTTGARRSL